MLKNVSTGLIDNVKDLRIALNELTVYDLNVYSSIEVYYKVANKLNEVITELGRFEGVLSDEVVKQNEKLIYLLGEGLETEVVKEVDNLINKGFFDEIINIKIFNDLNKELEYKANKTETQNIQNQINNLVLESGGDSNLEVVQGRTNTIGLLYPTINDRLNSIEKLVNTGFVNFVIDKWVNGSINNTGVDVYFPSRLSSVNYYNFPYKANLTVESLKNNYNVKVFYYTKNGDSYTYVGGTNSLEKITLEINPNYYYRFSIGTIDGLGTATTDIVNNYEFKVDYLKPNYLINEVKEILKNGTENLNISFQWEVGTFDSTGNVAYFPTRVRTTDFYKFNNDTDVIINSNDTTVGIRVFSYQFVNGSYTFISSTPTFENTVNFKFSKDLYYKFTVGKIDNNVSDGNIAWGDTFNFGIDISPSYIVTKEEFKEAIKDLENPSLITKELQNNIVESMIREKNRNPFEFKEFDKGFISIVFDDLRGDLDLVASIFAEFNYPLCVSAIPEYLNNVASGLNSASNGFTTGMRMKDILVKVQNNGGEIFSHNASVVNIENQYDYDFMYNYYTKNKKILVENGFNVRGLIGAGGTGAITKTKEIEKWLILNYDYANQGSAINYSHVREYLNQPINTLKNIVNNAITNKKWVQFYGHTINGSEGQLTESNLRQLLQFCKDSNVDVVTYAHIFDNYSSTKLENMINKK